MPTTHMISRTKHIATPSNTAIIIPYIPSSHQFYKLEFVNFTVQEIAAMLLLNPYSDKNIPSESAHRIVGIRAVVKSEHGIIAPFTEQRSALAADIIRRSDPA